MRSCLVQDGIASAAKANQTIIDTTTLDRLDAIDIAKEASKSGIAYWDCPISGMPFRADDGTLTVMFGGTSDAFASYKSYLEAIGEFIVHAGPLGSGQAMKAINNIIYNVNIVALCEVLPLAVAAGLDPDEVARVVTSASSRSFASEYFVPRMMERRFDTDFAMKDAYKDIVNVQRMAVETKAMTPVVNAMIASYQAAIAEGLGDEPKSAMLKVYERALGVQFTKPKLICRWPSPWCGSCSVMQASSGRPCIGQFRAFDRDAMHQSALPGIVVDRLVPRGAVVPDRDRTRSPANPAGELRFGAVLLRENR